MRREEIEIMAPVGSYESLMAAVGAGADSVYFGVEQLNMRARSSANFTLDDLDRIVSIAREHGVKTYLTLNVVVYDEEFRTMEAVVDRALHAGVDAVIAADMSVILYARSVGMKVHISTQLNVSNSRALRFYAQWADVVVLARELTLEQVGEIYETIRRDGIRGPQGKPVRIEMFVHGALCMSISGKCYLSLHECGQSANRGACRQICRRSYELRDRDTGEELRAEGRYLLSPKDLCTIGFLDRMLDAGVRVLKIEGRARSAEYVSRVVRCYDEAVRACTEGTFSQERVRDWEERLASVFNRGFWSGYYLGVPTVELSTAYGSSATKRKVYVGKVVNFYSRPGVAEIRVEAAPLEQGAEYVVTGPTTGAVEGVVAEVYVDEHPVEVAPQGVSCSVKTAALVRRGDKFFKIVDASEVTGQS